MKCVKVIWIALALVVLLITLARFDGAPNSDVEEFLFYSMAFLGFPLAWLAGGLMAWTLNAIHLHWSVIDLDQLWRTDPNVLTYFSVGYYQWFHLARRRLRK
jgi:hypothetical protein